MKFQRKVNKVDKYFITYRNSQIISNNRFQKVEFIGYQTGFNIGVIKYCWKINHLSSFVTKRNIAIILWWLFVNLGGLTYKFLTIQNLMQYDTTA